MRAFLLMLQNVSILAFRFDSPYHSFMNAWLAFLFLGCIAWGTSFLWIKIALRELGPLTLVTWRMLFGVATAWALVVVLRVPVKPGGRRMWLPMFLGMIGASGPIALISWAETRIDSGLAGVLNATMPIWTMLVAHFALHDDRFSVAKVTGMFLGFGGLFLLLNPKVGIEHDLLGQLAVVAAAILYAFSTVSMRKFLRDVHPVEITAWMLIGGSVFVGALAFLFEAPFAIPRLGMTWLACSWMGIIGMGLAAATYMHLIHVWGATRTSMVTYLFPVAAIILGVIFLDETLTWDLAVGTLLIIGGIALVNVKRGAFAK
jgi:drug/metabolite transporter (DMT)-like permease